MHLLKPLLLCAVGALSFSSHAQSFEETQLKECGSLSGPVVSIKTRDFGFRTTALSNDSQNNKYLLGGIQEYVFDKASKTIMHRVYAEQDTNTLYFTGIKSFDPALEYTGTVEIKKGDTSFHVRTINTYDPNKRLVEKKYVMKGANKKDSLYFMVQNKFNGQGQLTERAEFEKGKTLTQKFIYTYNKVGKKTAEAWYVGKGGYWSMIPCGKNKQTWYVPDTGFFQKQVFVYDAANREIETVDLNAHKCAVRRQTKKYDADNNVIEKDSYDENNTLVHQWKGRYEKGKLVLEEWYNANNVYGGKYEYKYNEAGLNTETIFYDKTNTQTGSIQWTYDSYGNWVSRLEISRGRTLSLRTRTIVYGG